MKRSHFLFAALLGLLVLVLVLARPAARAVGRHLVRQDAPGQPDAIVVLGGDVYKRAPHAAVLYAQGLAPVVVAVGGTADQGELSEARKTTRVLLDHAVPESAIVALGVDEPSTTDEARATAELVALRGWTRLAIVTSPYHTWRSGEIFEHALPDTVTVAMIASPLDAFDPDAWWTDERQRRLVRNEYGKFVLWKLGG